METDSLRSTGILNYLYETTFLCHSFYSVDFEKSFDRNNDRMIVTQMMVENLEFVMIFTAPILKTQSDILSN